MGARLLGPRGNAVPLWLLNAVIAAIDRGHLKTREALHLGGGARKKVETAGQPRGEGRNHHRLRGKLVASLPRHQSPLLGTTLLESWAPLLLGPPARGPPLEPPLWVAPKHGQRTEKLGTVFLRHRMRYHQPCKVQEFQS